MTETIIKSSAKISYLKEGDEKMTTQTFNHVKSTATSQMFTIFRDALVSLLPTNVAVEEIHRQAVSIIED